MGRVGSRQGAPRHVRPHVRPTPATAHRPAPAPDPGSSGPPHPGHAPESGCPADGLHLFTLGGSNPAGSHDFRALAGALWYWLATSSQVGSHLRRPTKRWTATSSQRPRVIIRGAFLFSANLHALLRLTDYERAIRVPIAESTRFPLPGADFGVRALCLGDPGREHEGWFTAGPVLRPRPLKAGLRSRGDTIDEQFSGCSLVHSFTTSTLVCATALA